MQLKVRCDPVSRGGCGRRGRRGRRARHRTRDARAEPALLSVAATAVGGQLASGLALSLAERSGAPIRPMLRHAATEEGLPPIFDEEISSRFDVPMVSRSDVARIGSLQLQRRPTLGLRFAASDTPIISEVTSESCWFETPLRLLLVGCRLVAVEHREISGTNWARVLRSALESSAGGVTLSLEAQTQAVGSICRYMCSVAASPQAIRDGTYVDWRHRVFATQRIMVAVLFSDRNLTSDAYDMLDAVAARLVRRQIALLLATEHAVPLIGNKFAWQQQSTIAADKDAMASLQRRLKQCNTIPWPAHRSRACQLNDAMVESLRLSGIQATGGSLQLACALSALSDENRQLRTSLSALGAAHDSLAAAHDSLVLENESLRSEFDALQAGLARWMPDIHKWVAKARSSQTKPA